MLNIKEIFKSDLDPNSLNWWALDKIDKINFNFNQLEKGGSYGPTGSQGTDGTTGVAGSQGISGNKGATGPQGTEGLSGKFTWNINVAAGNATINPKYQDTAEYSSIALVTGAITGSPEYDTAISDDRTPAVFIGNSEKNIFELANDSRRMSWDISQAASAQHEADLNIGKLETVSQATLTIDEPVNYKRLYKDTEGNNLLEVINESNEQLIKVYVNSEIDKDIEAVGDFSYNKNASENKVLVSKDTDGNSEWKNRFEVFSALPRGSFVSIREEDFNSNNFHILDGSEIGSDGYLKIGYGRGKAGTMFEGWYISNGQKWTDSVLQFEVPDLNSFNYEISNTNGSNVDYEGPEIDLIVTSLNPVIIAGSNTRSDAVYNNTTLEYDVVQTVEVADDSLSLPTASGTSDLAIKRNVNIIKLGEASLYWLTDPSQGAIIPTQIILTEVANTYQEACAAALKTYLWTGSNWINGPLGTLYSNSNGFVGASPIAGWYQREDLSRYWTGSDWAPIDFACPTVYLKNLVVRSSVIDVDLNGQSLPAGVNEVAHNIDTPLFKDATTITIGSSGSVPNAGWIREFGSGVNTYRRYWNGNTFTGVSIDKLYVTIKSGPIGATALNNSGACSTTFVDNITLFFGRNTNPLNDSPMPFWNLDRVYNTLSDTSTLYVNLNWVQSLGTKPLIGIYDQGRPGTSQPYYSLVEDKGVVTGKKYALIKPASTLLEPISCVSQNNAPTINSALRTIPTPGNDAFRTITNNTSSGIWIWMKATGGANTSFQTLDYNTYNQQGFTDMIILQQNVSQVPGQEIWNSTGNSAQYIQGNGGSYTFVMNNDSSSNVTFNIDIYWANNQNAAINQRAKVLT
tara:strand:- start:29954 stop:32518 length:2565 start_codon:yes stop_codon:yes gene_type:complete